MTSASEPQANATIAPDFGEVLSRCLSQHWGVRVTIGEVEPIYGGASRILMRFVADCELSEGAGRSTRRLILRLDPETSFVESDRATEFAALKALHANGLPVPEPVFLDSDGRWLGAPFLLMAEVEGGKASGFFDRAPYGEHAAKLGTQLYRELGRIAALETQSDLVREAFPVRPTDPAGEQLEHWCGILESSAQAPQPILHSAIMALRRRKLEPPARLSVVHGDFRSGNFLFGSRGDLLALLDWEFVHLGDPLEDLAWSVDPLWAHGETDRVGALLPLEEAVRCWEEGSGMRVDPVRLDWWRLFAAVRGMVMWTSSAEQFYKASLPDPSSAFPDLGCRPLHERVLAETLWRWEGL